MKKTFILFAASAAVLAACSEKADTDTTIAGSEKTAMTFNTELTETKTVLQEDGKVFWEADDAISIFDGTYNNQFNVKSLDGSSAVFTGEAAEVEKYSALYPYNAGASFADGVITTDLPTEQTAVAGSFAGNMNISAATAAANGTLTFKNILGLVKITLNSIPDGKKLTSVTFQGRKDESLTGILTINTEDFTSGIAGSPLATLIAEDGFAAGSSYYFAVHPASLEGGFVLTFKYADGASAKLVSSNATEIKAGHCMSIKALDAPPTSTAAENTYLLSTLEDLLGMKGIIDGATASDAQPVINFELVSDINMEKTDWTPLYAPDGYPWDKYPVINFDGNGHTLKSLNVNGKAHASFFGVLIGSCTNLTIANPAIVSDNKTPVGTVASTLASYNRTEKSYIDNVYVMAGSVTGADGITTTGNWDTPAYAAGGICGVSRNGSSIKKSRSSAKVDGTIVGGIIGAGQDGGIIEFCHYDGDLYAHGAANADAYAGGIAGLIEGNTADNRFWIKTCHSDGKYDSKDMGQATGGIVGKAGNDSWIEYSYSEAEIEGRQNAGGILGNGVCAGLTVLNCVAWNKSIYTEPYNSDSQYGIGHIIGYIKGTYLNITGCYANHGITLSRKSPESGEVETISLDQDDYTEISTGDTEVTRDRYCGTKSESLEAALSSADIKKSEIPEF